MPPALKILAPFGCVAGRAGARGRRTRGVRRARRANLGVEIGEEPLAGGGESIFSRYRHGVTRRVFDVASVEVEADVGEEGQGPRQTGNIVVGSIDGENISYESEH